MSATIKIFCVGTRSFKHVRNTRDGSVELQDEQGVILLVYDANARVRDREGWMGVFRTESVEGSPHWVYYGRAPQKGVDLGPDLPMAEVAVSRRYLSKVA